MRQTRHSASTIFARRRDFTGGFWGIAVMVVLAGVAEARLSPVHAQQFAQDSNEVPIGTFQLQGQGLAVDSSPHKSDLSAAPSDPDSARRWFLQRFELSLRESKDARQAMLDEGEGELKNGRLAEAQRLFERLIADAPDTDEAKAARAHLAELYRPKRDVAQPEASQDRIRNATRVSQAVDEEFLTSAGDRVFFAEGKADLGLRARAVIQAQARYLKEKSEFAVVIEGHVDDSVPPDDGKSLGESRARAVRDLLISEGVSASRIMTVSKGQDERVSPCEDSPCRAQNRRAVTVLMNAGAGQSRLKSTEVNDPDDEASKE